MTATILGHIKVLDLSRVLAGPWCTQSLADMGATVYKIERPQFGDEMRQSPPFLRDRDGALTADTVPFIALNRGKQSVAIDFTKPEGQSLVLDLARRCDVLVENLKAGDLKRYGLDYESVQRVNPAIVYCSITGYGQTGPMASLPGYDPVFQAISGIMSTCGLPDDEPGGGPMRSMLPLVDVMTGMVSTSAVLAALLHRERTGEGQHLDTALLDVAMSATVHLGQTQLSLNRNPKRSGNGSLLFAPSNCFPCRDGLIFIQIGNDAQWKRLCVSLGREDWLLDARFAGNASRVNHKAEVNEAVATMTRNFSKNALSDQLGAAGVPCGPVNEMSDAFDHPQVRHRETRVDLTDPDYGTLPVIRSPFRFSRTPVEHRLPPKVLGADTRSVLERELKMDSGRWAELKLSGAI